MDWLPEELRQEVIRCLTPRDYAQLQMVNRSFYAVFRPLLLQKGWFDRLKIHHTDISAMLQTNVSKCIKVMSIKLEPESKDLKNFLALDTELERPAHCIIDQRSEVGEWGGEEEEVIWKVKCTFTDISPPTACAPSKLPALQEIHVLVEGPRLQEMSLALMRACKGIKKLRLTAAYFWLPAEEIWPSLEILEYENTGHDSFVPEGFEESKLQDTDGTLHDLQGFIQCHQELQKFQMTNRSDLVTDVSRDVIHDVLKRALCTILDPDLVDLILIQAKGTVKNGRLCERVRAQRIFDQLGDIDDPPTLLEARRAVFEVYKDEMVWNERQWIEGRFPSVRDVTCIWKPNLRLERAMQGVNAEDDTHAGKVSWFEDQSEMKGYTIGGGDASIQFYMRVIPEFAEY